MKAHLIPTTWLRVVAAAALATPMTLALGAVTGDAALQFDGGELTRFEIDGDAVPGVSSSGAPANGFVLGDWGLGPADYGYGPQAIGATDPPPVGIGSTGVLPTTFADARGEDFPIVSPAPNPQYPTVPGSIEFCPEGEDDNWEGGAKVQSLVDIDDPLTGPGGTLNLGCGQTLDKGDLFRAYAAYEIVAIPNVSGDPSAGSQQHTILYGAWERGEFPGELNFYIPVADAVPGNSAGDRLIAFDYDSSAPATYRVLFWNGVEWVVGLSGSAGAMSSTFQAAVGFADGSPFGAKDKPTFGEFALDLTAAGVLPDSADGECLDLTTAGYIFTETGNSATAQLKDYVLAPRLPIGNCGPLDVVKAGPEVVASPAFAYRVEQQDGAAIFPTSTLPAGQDEYRIDEFLAIGETDQWIDLYAQPDYLVFEPEPLVTDPASPGWSQQRVTCTFVDAFASGYPIVTETTFVGTEHVPGAFVQIHSDAFFEIVGRDGFVPSCTITNDAAGVIVEKAGAGDAAQTFAFDVNGEDVRLAIGELAFVPFEEGTSVTITELPTVDTDPAWDLTTIDCYHAGSIEPYLTVTDGDAVTVEARASSSVDRCVFTNVQRGTITIEKTATPDLDAIFAFESTLGGFDLADGDTITFPDVVPGTYTFDETELPGWSLAGIECASARDASATVVDLADGSVDVTLGAGDAVTCRYANAAEAGSITIRKTTEGGDGEFTFALAGESGPPLEIVVTTSEGTGSTTVDGLVPGTTYTLTEIDPGDRWIAGDLVCTVQHADGSTTLADVAGFRVLPGDAVTCGTTNTEQGMIVVDKVTFPPSATTVFAFVLAGGGSSETLTVTGPGSPAASGFLPPGTYTVTELDEPGWVFQGATCDGGAVDGATATIELAAGTTVTCTFTNARHGPLTITKTVTAGPTRVAFDTYELTYQVVVASQSYVPETYDLVDVVRFGDGITVRSTSATGPAGVALVAGWNGTTATRLVDDATIGPLATHVFTVKATGEVAPTAIEDALDCVLTTAETGTGFLNESTVTWLGGTATDDDCRPAPEPEEADLAIVKTASVATTGPDGAFEWALEITNLGPRDAVGVVVGDLVPTKVTVTGVSSGDFTCGRIGNTVSCTRPLLAVGDSGEITISVVVPADAVQGSVANVGTVQADTPDPDLTNNSDDAVVDIVVQLAPTTTTAILPATGSNSSNPLWAGALLVLLGSVVLVARRRGGAVI